MGQTYRVMQSAFSGRVGHALPRWRILLALHENGQCSQKHLAERCRLDPASLTRQLQAMQKLGWIARAVDTHDNRLTNARLTPPDRPLSDSSTKPCPSARPSSTNRSRACRAPTSTR